MSIKTLDCGVCGAKVFHLCVECESDLTPHFFDFDAALEKKKRYREIVTLILKTAGDYDEWLTSNRRVSSFSTFVKEFGFDGENSSAIFAKVEETREFLLQVVGEKMNDRTRSMKLRWKLQRDTPHARPVLQCWQHSQWVDVPVEIVDRESAEKMSCCDGGPFWGHAAGCKNAS